MPTNNEICPYSMELIHYFLNDSSKYVHYSMLSIQKDPQVVSFLAKLPKLFETDSI